MVETKCHDPTQPLNGVVLDDYSSSDCVLSLNVMNTSVLRLCACTGRECNKRLLLSKPDDQICECSCSVRVCVVSYYLSFPYYLSYNQH